MNRFFKVKFELVFLLFVSFHTSAQVQKKQMPLSKNSAAQTSTQSAASNSAEGERRFKANCGRCHTPPEDLSPREARAVLRQMRVRAMLSDEDERLILSYLAP